MNNFRKLNIWKKSIELATNIYQITKDYPKEEVYGIVSQMRRSVISISSNIAEGSGRKSDNEFKQFLHIAYGSACELETQLLISRNLNYINLQLFNQLFSEIDQIQKMIFVLSQKIGE